MAAAQHASIRHCTMRLALLAAMLLLVWPQPLGVRCFDWQYEMAVSAIEKHKLADIPVGESRAWPAAGTSHQRVLLGLRQIHLPMLWVIKDHRTTRR